MTTPSRDYLVICPCRDEAKYLQRTIDSLIAQTVQPKMLLVVDDGSTDATPEMLADYEKEHDFIKVVRKPDRGGRSVGPGVIETFYYGWEQVDVTQFEYVTKLDLDLDLPPRYFETLIEKMEANPRIGTCSGKPYFPERAEEAIAAAANIKHDPHARVPDFERTYGPLISEACGDEMSVGMTKFYRRVCFEDIGGFAREVMWDGIDCHTCRMMGWIACSWDLPELRFVHLRPMGSSHKGVLTGRMRHGFGQHYMGTGLAYMTASAVFRMTRPPYLVGGLGMWLGYVKSVAERKPRYGTSEFRDFLREYQWACLVKGKTAATAELNDRQRPVWERRFGAES
ncbi:MAG: glycosyltransferase family 2 protein [Myxococcota bacterium]